MLKNFLSACVTVLLVLILLTVGLRYLQKYPGSPIRITSTGPTVQQLEQLAHLVSLRVHLADVLTGRGCGYRGAWLVKGDALLSVNLHRAKILDTNDETRTATLLLPQPTVLQARVDHSRTMVWSVEKTTWIPFAGNPDRLRDEAMGEAQRLINRAAASERNIQQARSNAESALRGFFGQTGWRIEVRWMDRAASNPQP